MKERKFTISLLNIRCSGMGRRYGMTNNYDQWYIIQCRNNVPDVIVWYDEQLQSMVHNSPFVNKISK